MSFYKNRILLVLNYTLYDVKLANLGITVLYDLYDHIGKSCCKAFKTLSFKKRVYYSEFSLLVPLKALYCALVIDPFAVVWVPHTANNSNQ